MTSRTNKKSAGNIRAAYMRQYKKIKRLHEDNSNNVPERSYLPRQREYIETHKNLSAEYTRNYRKGKAQEKYLGNLENVVR
jgi:hypothetical protein